MVGGILTHPHPWVRFDPKWHWRGRHLVGCHLVGRLECPRLHRLRSEHQSQLGGRCQCRSRQRLIEDGIGQWWMRRTQKWSLERLMADWSDIDFDLEKWKVGWSDIDFDLGM